MTADRANSGQPWRAAARAVAGVSGLALAGVAVWTGSDGWAAYSKFRGAFDAVPLRATVDVSRAGSTPVVYRQSYAAACGAVLWIERADLPGGDAGALDGLSGRIVFTNAGVAGTSEAPFRADSGTAWSEGLRLGALPTNLPDGDHRAEIVIETPAAGAGRVTFRGRYLLCGLEVVPAYLGWAIAAAAGVAGVGLLLAAALPAVRRLRPRAVPHA